MIVQKNGFWVFGGSVCLRYLELTKVDFGKGRYFHASDPNMYFALNMGARNYYFEIVPKSTHISVKTAPKNLFEVFTENYFSDVDEMSIKMASGFSTTFRATHSPVVSPLHVIYKTCNLQCTMCIAKLEL